MLRWIVVLALCAVVAQGRSLEDVRSQLDSYSSTPSLWKPSDGQSREDWLRRHGQPADVYRRTRDKLNALKKLIASETQQPQPAVAVPTSQSVDQGQDTASPDGDDTLDGCIWLTEDQIDAMMLGLNNDTDSHHRQKRAFLDFTRSPYSKWSMPVTYKFDGSHSIDQMATVRGAFKHFEDNTCVRFKEVPTDQDVNENHILITRQSTGCHSYVGRVSYFPQQLNLQGVCISYFGIPVHEILHALGMWHEQMRSDRDEWIKVNWNNIHSRYRSQFTKINTHNLVQYNYGSIMHYRPRDGSSANGQDTMQAVNPLYQRNMGQRTGLSFENIKAINLAYCADRCLPNRLARPCQHGGYQDPNDCSRCICADGFAGQFCDALAQPTNANCGGVIDLASGTSQTIKSPGYDSHRYYLSHQGCSWWFKAPKDHVIKLRFDGDFAVYCVGRACFHWVEVKYKADLGLEGPRFCCSERPSATLTSESNEMMVIFKSNYSSDYLVYQRGFQAVVTAVPTGSSPATTPSTTTTTTTPKPTTTTTTTTSTATPSTTTTTTTTTPSTTTTTPSTTTTRSSTTEDCSSRDLTLILDSSRSVTASDWTKLTSFVGRLVDDVRRRGVVRRVAVVTYSGRVRVALPLADHHLNVLTSLPFTPGSGRYISGALRLTRTELMDASSTRSSCLLVSTAGATVDRHRTVIEAERARQSRLGVVVLGVGSLVNGSEAAVIATHDDSGVVYADNFDHLLDPRVQFTSLLAEKICESDNHPNSGGSPTQLWSCSFEQQNNALCGMTQERSRDQFDWTVHSGRTPSEPTGPTSAHGGRFYAYIETSNPRRPNDEAWLILPKMDRSGVMCVDFYYHMYGFHVRSLRLVQRTTTSAGEVTRTVWMRSHQMGTTWYHGSCVDMSADSQLVFVGTRGDEYSGDIAIDDLKLSAGACP